MKKVIPEKTMYFCDLCNKELVNYVDYENSCRLKIIHTRKRKPFSFFKKEATDFTGSGTCYEYREMMVCGECYDKMVKYVEEKEESKNEFS